MISVHFQGKPFNITIIQVYAPTSNAEEAEVELFYEDLQDLLELTPKKDVLFIMLLLLLLSRFSRVQLSATPRTAAFQVPPSMGFSRQEYWSRVPLPSPKWTGMGEFNSDDHYIHTSAGRNPSEEME